MDFFLKSAIHFFLEELRKSFTSSPCFGKVQIIQFLIPGYYPKGLRCKFVFTLHHTIPSFNDIEAYKKHLQPAFSLFPTMFLPFQEQISLFGLDLLSENAFHIQSSPKE